VRETNHASEIRWLVRFVRLRRRGGGHGAFVERTVRASIDKHGGYTATATAITQPDKIIQAIDFRFITSSSLNFDRPHHRPSSAILSLLTTTLISDDNVCLL
jgi:hypothetical protein